MMEIIMRTKNMTCGDNYEYKITQHMREIIMKTK